MPMSTKWVGSLKIKYRLTMVRFWSDLANGPRRNSAVCREAETNLDVYVRKPWTSVQRSEGTCLPCRIPQTGGIWSRRTFSSGHKLQSHFQAWRRGSYFWLEQRAGRAPWNRPRSVNILLDARLPRLWLWCCAACGHPLIAVAGVASLLGLRKAMLRYNIAGRIILLGTPAEETGGGKLKLLQANACEWEFWSK